MIIKIIICFLLILYIIIGIYNVSQKDSLLIIEKVYKYLKYLLLY